MKKLLSLITVMLLTACGSDSDSDSDKSVENISDLEGVYDLTTRHSDNEVDEFYMHIDKSGYISYYDYAGDSYDNEGNCYWIDIKDSQITKTNNGFRITERDDDYIDVSISLTSSSITLKTDRENVSYPRSSRQLNDFSPDCDDI
ncbi:hypothetical protein [Bacterioplanoides sp. SCSIO 12839]|uniref:hypothetical protein n=1 Tax=Bacterioplanoides sp. SCSIO 12839 TaxID=2829569 RepID=UPI002101EEBA|nr:hypothetical protein [Bacterioplanoides sp. SCSIO 12839]UTW48044.1 hypothetical protein KFF03_16035 [Bacterioplanoides sp. SCSIO 12839]